MPTQDLRRDARQAWARFCASTRALPADEARPLWQVAQTQATLLETAGRQDDRLLLGMRARSATDGRLQTTAALQQAVFCVILNPASRTQPRSVSMLCDRLIGHLENARRALLHRRAHRPRMLAAIIRVRRIRCWTPTWSLQYLGSHNDAIGTRVVSSAKEFRENASECFGWARIAKTNKERDIFVQMARAWLDAAARHDGVSQPPNAPSVPLRGDSPSAGK
jgi:hypothetical protein